MRLIDAEALRVAVRTLLNDRASGATDETVFDVITNAPILHAEQWAGRDEFVMSEYANKEDLYKAMLVGTEPQQSEFDKFHIEALNLRITDQAATIETLLSQQDQLINQVTQLQLDNAKMREALESLNILAESAQNSNEPIENIAVLFNDIFSKALVTQPTEYNPFINEDK